MSKDRESNCIPLNIGLEPLVGSHYAAECTVCGWIGSSEVLTDDSQCTQDSGGRYCFGDSDEIGPGRLLEIVQAMYVRHGESQQAYHRLIDHTNKTERHLDAAAGLLGEIVERGQAYRECTMKGSPTALKVNVVLTFVAQFQPETNQSEDAAARVHAERPSLTPGAKPKNLEGQLNE